MDKTSRQKLNKEILEPTDIIKEMDLRDIHRPFHSNTEEFSKGTFFSAPHGTFSKTDYILKLKVSLNRYKKIETQKTQDS